MSKYFELPGSFSTDILEVDISNNQIKFRTPSNLAVFVCPDQREKVKELGQALILWAEWQKLMEDE